ncbi:MAG: Rossmann-like and DUF2520 domain-containing protein [Saprospiraceae bacterium]
MIAKVVLIGSGHVANHLGRQLHKRGIIINQLVARNKTQADLLAKDLNTLVNYNLDQVVRKADAYLLCVNDDAIAEVSTLLTQRLSDEKTIIHFSGSKSYEEINPYFKKRAVIWPLQSFSENAKLNWKQIPFFIDGELSIVNEILDFCKGLKWNGIPVDQEKKKLIHLAAVFANNFSNFNYVIAEQILNSIQIEFKVLEAILNNSSAHVFEMGPEKMQSGPARRKDAGIIKKQISLLQTKFPEYKKIYEDYSKLIINHYHGSKNFKK